MRSAWRWWLLLATVALRSAAAQDPTPAPAPSPNQPVKRIVVDRVIATINDATILESELWTSAAGTLRTNREKFGPLHPRMVEQIVEFELRTLIDHRCLAQAAKSLGPLTPEQVEKILRSEFERAKRDEVRDHGSLIALSQELERQGRTWETLQREMRERTLFDLATELAIHRRLQKQQNLFLTPRMLREAYQANKERFVHAALARVGLLVFRGPTALADATAAAAMWRDQVLTSRELAERFPSATALNDMEARSLHAELAEFARVGPAGAVSEPIARADTVQLAKVLDYVPARNGRFEDADVQEQLRQMCQLRVKAEFEAQAMQRAYQRTEVKRYPDGPRGR